MHMRYITHNPNEYRYGDIKVGDRVLIESYKYCGYLQGVSVDGVCNLFGIVKNIPNEYNCTVSFCEIENNGNIIKVKDRNQYTTAINLWCGRKESIRIGFGRRKK